MNTAVLAEFSDNHIRGWITSVVHHVWDAILRERCRRGSKWRYGAGAKSAPELSKPNLLPQTAQFRTLDLRVTIK